MGNSAKLMGDFAKAMGNSAKAVGNSAKAVRNSAKAVGNSVGSLGRGIRWRLFGRPRGPDGRGGLKNGGGRGRRLRAVILGRAGTRCGRHGRPPGKPEAPAALPPFGVRRFDPGL